MLDLAISGWLDLVSERVDLVRKADIDETNLCQVPIRGMSAYRTAAVGAKRTFNEA
jgi:hypothetical protein